MTSTNSRIFHHIRFPSLLPVSFGLAMAFCACTIVAEPKNGSPKTLSKPEAKMNSSVFKMTDDDFFATPLQVSPEVGRELIREGFDGLVIGAPVIVNLDKHSKLPLVAVRVAESRDASLRLFKEFAIVAAMELSTGTLYADFFIEQKFAKVKREPGKNPPPPGKTADAASADLFARLDLPKSMGEYLVTTLVFDKCSNRALIRVGPSKVFQNPELFSKQVAENRSSDSVEAPVVVSGEYKDSGQDEILTLPKEPGIKVGVVSIPGRDRQPPSLLLQGVFHLPGSNANMGLGGSRHEGEVRGFPVTILATGSRIPAPLTWKFRIIVSEPRGNTSENLKGRFSVNLTEMGGIEGNQTYAIYAFTGEFMSGPATISLPSNSDSSLTSP